MIYSKVFFERVDKYYYRTIMYERNDIVMEILFNLFGQGTDTNFIKRGLLDPSCKGMSDFYYHIFKENEDDLSISESYECNPEEREVYFSKKKLLNLIDKWQDLLLHETQLIVFYRNGDEYGIVDAQDFHEA